MITSGANPELSDSLSFRTGIFNSSGKTDSFKAGKFIRQEFGESGRNTRGSQDKSPDNISNMSGPFLDIIEKGALIIGIIAFVVLLFWILSSTMN